MSEDGGSEGDWSSSGGVGDFTGAGISLGNAYDPNVIIGTGFEALYDLGAEVGSMVVSIDATLISFATGQEVEELAYTAISSRFVDIAFDFVEPSELLPKADCLGRLGGVALGNIAGDKIESTAEDMLGESDGFASFFSSAVDLYGQFQDTQTVVEAVLDCATSGRRRLPEQPVITRKIKSYHNTQVNTARVELFLRSISSNLHASGQNFRVINTVMLPRVDFTDLNKTHLRLTPSGLISECTNLPHRAQVAIAIASVNDNKIISEGFVPIGQWVCDSTMGAPNIGTQYDPSMKIVRIVSAKGNCASPTTCHFPPGLQNGTLGIRAGDVDAAYFTATVLPNAAANTSLLVALMVLLCIFFILNMTLLTYVLVQRRTRSSQQETTMETSRKPIINV